MALNGCIVTIDAMGTQTEIAQQILEQGGDYILSLKGNQGNLHEDVQQLFDWARRVEFREMAHEFHKTVDAGHGRVVIGYWMGLSTWKILSVGRDSSE